MESEAVADDEPAHMCLFTLALKGPSRSAQERGLPATEFH